MKITKHKVESRLLGSEQVYYIAYCDDYESAVQRVSRGKQDIHASYLYAGTVEIDLECENCDAELHTGDDYIKIDDFTRYCSDCYSTEISTTYYIDGEYVGADNDIEEYSEWSLEVSE